MRTLDDGEAATIGYLQVLRAILCRAYKLTNPLTKRRRLEVVPEIPWAEEFETSARPFGLKTFIGLYNDAPQHLRETMIVCLLFGFRLSQALSAKASNVDLELGGYWVRRRGNTKAERRGRGHKHRREIFVPFGPWGHEFVAALKARAERLSIDRLIIYQDHITGKWRPIKSVTTAWQKLLIRHGLKGIHTFHNIKTTLLSNIASFAPFAVAQEMGQHKDPRTTHRHYVAIEDDPKREAMELFEKNWPRPASFSRRSSGLCRSMQTKPKGNSQRCFARGGHPLLDLRRGPARKLEPDLGINSRSMRNSRERRGPPLSNPERASTILAIASGIVCRIQN